MMYQMTIGLIVVQSMLQTTSQDSTLARVRYGVRIPSDMMRAGQHPTMIDLNHCMDFIDNSALLPI